MEICNLGHIHYSKAHQIQLDAVSSLLSGQGKEILYYCSHPPVVTLGKKSSEKDLHDWPGDVFKIERGGKATYHGPGQLVIYPIINLNLREQNISKYLSCLEMAVIDELKQFNLIAHGNSQRGRPDFTGVWIENRKIASLGIAVKRWVTYHGLAINVEADPLAFTGMSPCGFSSDIMTSLERELKMTPDKRQFEKQIVTRIAKNLRIPE
jgi:lipoyl(octanoyl) transferase